MGEDKNKFEGNEEVDEVEEIDEDFETSKTDFSGTQKYSVDESSLSSEYKKTQHDYQNNFKDNDDVEIKKIVREEIKRNYKKPKNKGFKTIALVLIGAILGSIITNIIFIKTNKYNGSLGENNETVNINTVGEVNVEKAVAKKALPSVVGISTLSLQESMSPFEQGREVMGTGSGVIIRKDGYILTNSHVVGDGNTKSIKVLFDDGESSEASLLWNDTVLDLAIIKAERDGLTPITLGDSDKVEVGEKAIAIGNPLGLELQSTLTSGYISGKNRNLKVGNGVEMTGLLQTDASINPGNSGGALLNEKGDLIGINTAKAQGTDGIGFAIPINTAKPIVDSVIKTGKYESIQLGIAGADVASFQAMTGKDLGTDTGVVVTNIEPDSIAAQSGIEVGDVITKIDKVEVNNMGSLKKELMKHVAGDEGTITVLRNGKDVDLEIIYAKTR